MAEALAGGCDVDEVTEIELLAHVGQHLERELREGRYFGHHGWRLPR
jgi:hypothetical protein